MIHVLLSYLKQKKRRRKEKKAMQRANTRGFEALKPVKKKKQDEKI